MNPFDILGLPPRFDLDEAALQRRFITLSAAHHPDRFTDPLAQADAAERSAAINQAYRVLKDPEERANALLALLGGPDKEQDKSLPPDLLMEMMEVRERQEEALAEGNAEELARLAAWARRQRQAKLEAVGALFAQALAQTPADPDTLQAIRLQLNALRYFERMIEQLPRGE